MDDTGAKVVSAEVVLPCKNFVETLAFFVDRLGFRVDTVSPADDPAMAVLTGHGLRLRLARDHTGPPGVLCLRCENPERMGAGASQLVAPNGTVIELAAVNTPVPLPPLQASLVVTEIDEHATWHEGRAGMRYRDLIPDRQGGRYIASHIQIPDGGSVPDYVHFHDIRFQMIYCYKGWVRVVYEDQGASFVLQAGDCVLQPPKIRHRVLESSPGLEVIEIGSPALHETFADHELALPTAEVRPDRDFGGQVFVRHQAEHASWQPWCTAGFEARDLGMAAATRGLADVHVVRASTSSATAAFSHSAELAFTFVLDGQVTLRLVDDKDAHSLRAGDSFVIPAGRSHQLIDGSDDLQFLQVTVTG